MLVKRDIAPVKGFEDGGKKRGVKLILVQWETRQATRDFNHSLICFLISKESGYGLYHLLPKCGLTNKGTDVTPYSSKVEGVLSLCPLPVSSPHSRACSGALWLPAEAMQVPNLQATSQSFGGIEKCQEYSSPKKVNGGSCA